jgi:hypothetical protein
MTFAKQTVAALVLLVCLSGLQGCAQSEEQRAAMEQRLAGLRVETVNGLRVVCLQAPPAGCPSNTTNPVIINDSDRTTYVTIADRGATASLFLSNVTQVNRRAHLFVSSYTNNRDIEILVNAEDTPDINQARLKAISIALELGRMPVCVLKEAKQVKIQSTSGVGLDVSGTQGDREDVAESFVAYYGARFARDRVGAFFANTVNAAIPNRIAYFERFCPST